MARVRLLSNDEVAPEIREMFEKIEANGFRVLNLFRIMAHCPRLGRHFMRLGNSILFKGSIPANLRELAILRVGNINQANYEWTHHIPIALQAGVKKEQIEDIPDWEKSKNFNEQERAVLRYTDEVTKNIRVSDGTFDALRSFLKEEAIVELTTTIGYYGMVSRILEALKVELEN